MRNSVMEKDKLLAPHLEKNEIEVFENKKSDIEFYIGKNLRYHAKRRDFFERWDNATKILNYIIGSATIVAILAKQYELYAVLCNVLILILSAFDSFIGFGNKARDYKEFYQAYKKLEIKLRGLKTEDEINLLRQEIDKIELNEPNTLIVLMEKCWNEEVIYQRYGKENLRQIAWWQSLFAQYFDICPLRIAQKSKELYSQEETKD